MKFLTAMAPNWNISLFHYRNQGADFSSALVGIQAPLADSAALDAFLLQLGYAHFEETDNEAYRQFLI
ncbi:L-threonine dehydratase biosynthetic IlvA [compost metagenome]